jgi:hypothetical protein
MATLAKPTIVGAAAEPRGGVIFSEAHGRGLYRNTAIGSRLANAL